jgi:elongation factor 1 alpha-like protein
VFKGQGGQCVGGKVETGMVQAGDKVMVQPMGEIVTVKSISMEEGMGPMAFAGDPVLISLHGVSDANILGAGCVLSDPNYPCRVSAKFQARVVTFDAMTVPLTKGFMGVMHLGSLQEQVAVRKLISQLHKGTGEVIKSKPRCLMKNSNALIELECTKTICIEEFKDVKELGRFTFRYAGVTIAAGVITKVL